MSDWQPIETAPKDGTHILLCCECSNHPPAYPLMVGNAAWCDEAKIWRTYQDMISDPPLHFKPTHWMPLPAPPVEDRDV